MMKKLLKASALVGAVALGAVAPVGNEAHAMRALVGDVYCSTWVITGANGEILNWDYRYDTCISTRSYQDPTEPYVADRYMWDWIEALFRVRVVKIPDAVSVNNPFRANCQSDEFTRWLHAEQDVATYYVGRGMPAGRAVEVTYDDGATEIWTTTNRMNSDTLLPVPAEGTLECN